LSWIRSPLLHFLSIGMALFVADGLREALVPFTRFATFAPFLPLATEQDPAPLQIEIDAARLDMLEQGFVTQMGRAPDPDESVRLLAAEVDEEILYREALARGLLERDGGVQTRLIQKMLFLDGAAGIENAGELLRRAKQLGLDQDDIVVRRILVQKMRLFGSTLEESERPSWESIAARYAQTREAFREPDRISFVQVFLSADERLGATQVQPSIRERSDTQLWQRFRRAGPRTLARPMVTADRVGLWKPSAPGPVPQARPDTRPRGRGRSNPARSRTGAAGCETQNASARSPKAL